MPENQINSVVATTSGLCGRVRQSIDSSPGTCQYNFPGNYGGSFLCGNLSLVGYGVKVSIDNLKKFYNRKRQ